MGVLHIISGVLLFLASRITANAPFYWLILLYSLFYMSAIVSVALRLFSFFLPDTPPLDSTPSSAKSIMGIDAFVLFRDKPYLIFFIAAIFVCIGTWFSGFVTNYYTVDQAYQWQKIWYVPAYIAWVFIR